MSGPGGPGPGPAATGCAGAPAGIRRDSAGLRVAAAVAVAALLVCPALTLAQGAGDAPLFRDITESTGIAFRHNSAPEKKYIVESMSGGVGLFDVDRDGLLDIYFVNSLTVDTANEPESSHSALYRNLGDGTFRDIAAEAGVAHPGWGMGLCIADVDGDGWQDLYVTGIGRNRLYRNSGDDTFTDVATELGVAASGWSTGCGFADYDRDGDLDLFVSRYVEFDLDNLPEFGSDKTCQYRGVSVQCGPRGLPGTSDLLFRQEANGAFTEVGEEAGVRDPDGYFGLGIAWLDMDGDGWLDLYVANDSTPNYLYMNRKDGTFEESGFFMGVAVSEDGGESWLRRPGLGAALRHAPTLLRPSGLPLTVTGLCFAGDGWLAGVDGAGAWLSHDGGRSWLRSAEGLPAEVRGVWEHPEQPESAYAATRAGFFRSQDGGASWVQSLGGLDRTLIGDAAVLPGVSDVILLAAARRSRPSGGGAEAALFRSADGGIAWRRVTLGGVDSWPAPPAMCRLHGVSDTAFVAAGGRLWASHDRGGHWRVLADGIPECLALAAVL